MIEWLAAFFEILSLSAGLINLFICKNKSTQKVTKINPVKGILKVC